MPAALWGAATLALLCPLRAWSQGATGPDAGVKPITDQSPVEDKSAQERKASTEADESDERIAALLARADRLSALAKGELSPAVAPDALLRFDLAAAELEDLGALASMLGDGGSASESDARARRARLAAAAAEAAALANDEDPLKAAQGALRSALLGFLRLPDRKRRALIDAHAEARSTFVALSTERDRRLDERDRLAKRFSQAEAYLAGALDPQVAQEGLFLLDLMEPAQPRKAQVAAKRRRRAKVPWEQELHAEIAALDQQIEELTAGLRELTQYYAGLGADAREALQQARLAKLSAAEQARRKALTEKRRASDMEEDAVRARSDAEREQASAQAEREAALRAAEEARTEAQRLLAAEKARVLGRKAELSQIRGRIATDAADLTQRYDGALGLVRKTRELQERSVLDATKVPDADQLYAQITQALSDYHDAFSEALGWLLQPRTRLPDALTPSEKKFLAELDEPELNRLWDDLRRLRQTVEEEEAQLGRDRASSLRDAVVLLNDARLGLLRETSSDLRSRVSGFGPEGVEQAASEAQHMLLMSRYHLISLPNVLSLLRERARGATLMIFFSVVQVMLIVAAYRVYRRRAEPTLTRMYREALSDSDAQGFSRFFARVLWYLRRLYEPLGAWVFTAAMFSYIRGIDLLPELDFLWIILQWFFVGWTSVELVDAFAERQNKLMRQRSDDPRLRFRSLRLLAFFFLGTGMLLSLTERSVGEGTIFSWTRLIAWLALLPILIVLAHWWDPQTKAAMDARAELPGVLQWARRHMDGPLGIIGEVVAGAYLLGEGITRWAVRWMSEFESIQKLTAYLFRKKAQERGQSPASKSVAPLPQYGSFAPGRKSAEALLKDLHKTALSRVTETVKTAGTVSLVVGDRGMGKSAFLTRVASDVGEGCLRLSCPLSLSELRIQLQAELGVDGADDETLVSGLRSRHVTVLLLDDVQRLVRPAVFGLHEFDGLLALLRSLRVTVSTVMSCATPGYVLLSRGRGALGTDCVAFLEPLSRKEITSLIKSCCAAENIKPSFDELVVPRAFDVDSTSNEDPVELGYFRLLWDYSGGNPAVALFYFQRSLYRDDRGRLVVRVFEEPDRVALEVLPRSMPFVFRTLMQLSEGDVPTVARCLNLSENETRDVIEMGVRRGYLERIDESVRVALPWLREIKVMLRRQHLLS